jgi:hypothetical protein
MKATQDPEPRLRGTNNDTCVDPALDLLFLVFDYLSHTVPFCKMQPEKSYIIFSIITTNH